jgi:hypothetical protein
MRILARLIILFGLVHPAGAVGIDSFDGMENFIV